MDINYFDLTTEFLELAVTGKHTNKEAFLQIFGINEKESDHQEYHCIILSGLFSDITGNPNKKLTLSFEGVKCYAEIIGVKQARKYSTIAIKVALATLAMNIIMLLIMIFK